MFQTQKSNQTEQLRESDTVQQKQPQLFSATRQIPQSWDQHTEVLLAAVLKGLGLALHTSLAGGVDGVRLVMQVVGRQLALAHGVCAAAAVAAQDAARAMQEGHS